jgi:malate dehydrogenase (oxaloacetate-decarboxylating)
MALDSRGVVSDDREGLDEYKFEFAWPAAWLDEIGLDHADRANLERIVATSGCNVLIGTSGQSGTFTESVCRAMAANAEQPVILPLANPTDMSEAIPADIMEWTDRRALVATGSPFDPVEINGKLCRIGQANNVFIFPGLGLGAIISGARLVTETMIGASSTALAKCLIEEELGQRCLMPEVSRLWEVCGIVGLAVARQAVEDGVATFTDVDALEQRIAEYRWEPRYPEIIND